MPHIDDGILHAHLDGALPALSDAGELPDGMSAADVMAHLSACADCRARLEAERGIREQAGLVLRDVALPTVAVPPFADIAGAPVALPRSQPRRWMPLTWAATVLLAIGFGWWGSALWRAQDLAQMAALESVQSRAASSAPAPGVAEATTAESGAASPAEARENAALPVASRDGASPDGASPGDASRDVASRDDASRPDAAQADAGVVVADAPAPTVTGQAGSAFAAAARPAEPIGTVAAATGDSGAAARNPTSAGVPSRELAAGDMRGVTPAGDAMRLMQRVEEHVAVSPDRPLYVTTSDDLGTFAGMLAREQAGRMPFVPVSATDSDAVREQLFYVADASVPVIEMAREIGQTTVRVSQTLSSGEPVEVVSWKQVTLMLNELLVAGSAAADAERDSAAALRQRRNALMPTPRPAPAAAASPPVAIAPPPPPPAALQSRAEVERRANAEAKVLTDRVSPAFLVSTDPPRTLPDGRRELVLRSSSGPLWIAIRANLAPAALLDLVPRLTQADPDGR
jgi:hypothetical protein